MATPTAEPPEDDEAWLYGDPEKKEEVKAEAEAAASTLSADAPPFEPAAPMETEGDNEDKEAGEVSGEDPVDDDEDSDDDDVQVTIGDIKTQPQTYEKFKSGYTRSGQAKQHAVKGVDLETPGTVNDQSVFDYDLNSLNVEERAWRKPGADITDYFNYGFTEDTWMKYCDKQKYLRNENGVTSKMFIHSLPSAPRRESAPMPPKAVDPPAQSPQSYRPPTTPTQQATSSITVTPTSGQSAASLAHMAGPPPGRKMSGTIDVIGGTRNDSRRPKNMYDYENQSPSDSHTQDYSKKWTPTDLPPPHIPPPNYGVPPPMSVPPPGPVPPPPHMSAPPPLGYYPAPTGPPPDRGPPPGYDNRGAYGYDTYGAPPPGYGAPPPVQPSWDNRGSSWDYGNRDYSRDRSPVRSDSDFSSSGDEYEKRRYRGRQLYDPFERDLNYERNRQGRPRSRERERGESSSRDRERRHRDRERADREKEDRHRRSRKEGSVGAEHKSKHKKSKRSKRDKDDESMDTSQEPSSSPPS